MTISQRYTTAGFLTLALAAVLFSLGLLREGEPEPQHPGFRSVRSMPKLEPDFDRRSEPEVVWSSREVEPIHDHQLIAASVNLPARPLPDPPVRVERVRSEGYDPAAISAPSVGLLLEQVPAHQSPGKLHPDLRAFERSLRAKADQGLQQQDVDAALDYLTAMPRGIEPANYHALANDLIRMLVTASPTDPVAVGRLAALVDRDETASLVRDYIVQHFQALVRRPEFRQEAANRLVAWIENGRDSVPGTAILVIEQAMRDGVILPDEDHLRLLTLACAADPGHTPASRAAALSLCERQGWKGAAPAARAILGKPGSPLVLRLAAIHALGSLGDPAVDHEFLATRVHQPGGAMLRQAVDAALIHRFPKH